MYLLSGSKIFAAICVYIFLLSENLKVFGCSPVSPTRLSQADTRHFISVDNKQSNGCKTKMCPIFDVMHTELTIDSNLGILAN